MPARKASSKKSAAKSASAKGSPVIRPLYAVPIYEAMAGGNVQEMKKLAAMARKQIADVTAALNSLEKNIQKLN